MKDTKEFLFARSQKSFKSCFLQTARERMVIGVLECSTELEKYIVSDNHACFVHTRYDITGGK